MACFLLPWNSAMLQVHFPWSFAEVSRGRPRTCNWIGVRGCRQSLTSLGCVSLLRPVSWSILVFLSPDFTVESPWKSQWKSLPGSHMQRFWWSGQPGLRAFKGLQVSWRSAEAENLMGIGPANTEPWGQTGWAGCRWWHPAHRASPVELEKPGEACVVDRPQGKARARPAH